MTIVVATTKLTLCERVLIAANETYLVTLIISASLGISNNLGTISLLYSVKVVLYFAVAICSTDQTITMRQLIIFNYITLSQGLADLDHLQTSCMFHSNMIATCADSKLIM